jgi:hypothetical protein
VLHFSSTENILLMNKLMEHFVEHYLLVSLSDVVKEGGYIDQSNGGRGKEDA